MSRTYQEAIRLLTSRSKAFRKVVGDATGKPRGNEVGMREWLAALGHDDPRRTFDVIHVTGTKGKGATCAWTDALLRSHIESRAGPDRPARVGLYTSPHIVSERERIRVDFAPVSEDTFARHFFDVWDAILHHVGGRVDDMPGYLQLLALLSARVFHREGVTVAVYEVHAGGRFDATNLWDHPLACGFNAIGLDHVGFLGNTVAEIAWNKAGIMKKGARAISVPQTAEAEEQLVAEARRLGCELAFVDGAGDDALPADAGLFKSELRLSGPRRNLALAAALANTYLETRLGCTLSKQDMVNAIRTYQWPGRFQVVEPPTAGKGTRWYLDFAHNELSLPVALDWFAAEVQSQEAEEEQRHQVAKTFDPVVACSRVLIFGHESDFRKTASLADVVVRHCLDIGLIFDRVVLAGHSRRVSGRQVFGYDAALEVMEAWKGLAGPPEVTWCATIAEAMGLASQPPATASGGGLALEDGCVHTLIVGSSHLVSSAVAAMSHSGQVWANSPESSGQSS